MTAPRTDLRAGPLGLMLVGADLRYVTYRGQEIVRRIYMAVRDLDWDTIPAIEHERRVEVGEDSFSVRMSLSNRGGEIGLEWDLEIDGSADGTIEYVMRARALGDFEYAKIGLNVHHPLVGVSGRRWKGVAGARELDGVMPKAICPQIELRDLGVHVPMVPPVSELRIDQQAGEVRFDFGGDLYEMEDHRNWSDASYKTYSMPACTGYVHQATRGEEFVQRVRMEFEPAPDRPRPAGRLTASPPREGSGRLEIGPELGRTMPPLGICFGEATGMADELPPAALRPAHLRLDLDLREERWEGRLRSALADCAALGAELELALFTLGDPRGPLAAIESAVLGSEAALARVIVLPAGEEATPSGWVRLVRESFALGTPVGGGTNLYFNELHRSLPDLRPFPFLTWSINPQVHAFTDADLVENLDGQGEQVRSARSFTGDRKLCIGPVTLKPRFNAVARDGLDGSDNVDGRQPTRFAGAWTIGSIKQLAEAGVASATYYEATGPRGVAQDGEAFPALHALADACELRGAPLLRLESGEEPWLSGIAARSGESLVALVANLGAHPREIEVALGAAGATASVRVLDAGSEALARTQPAAFRSAGKRQEAKGDAFRLSLEPYAYARLQLV